MARVAIRIDLGAGVSLGPGKIALIEAILRTGSISAAAREIGMSYRRAWLHVDALNRMFAEPSVVTSPGRRGGGAEVTAFGRRLVELFSSIRAGAEMAGRGELAELTGKLAPAPVAVAPEAEESFG
jgi:molybdate transport system regulatory protein